MLGRTDGWSRTLVYGAAHYGKSLFWYGGEVLFAFYLTEVAGLAPEAMGLVLVVGFIASAVFDLVVGRRISTHVVDLGQAGALQAAGAAISGVVLVGFFAAAWLPEAARLWWTLCAGLAFRLGFSLYDIPQGVLMARAPADGAARARVTVVRIAGSGLAGLTVAGAVGPLIAAQRAGGGGTLLVALAAGAAMVALSSALALWRVLQGQAVTDTTEGLGPGEAVAARPGLVELWPFWVMMSAMMIGPPLFQKLEPYFAARSLLPSALGGGLILAAAAGVFVGQPIWLRISNQLGRRHVFLVSAALQAGGALVFLCAPMTRPELLLMGSAVFGLGNGGLGMAKWASFSDSVSRQPAHRQGLSFAVFGAISKLSLALTSGVVAWAVAAADADGASDYFRGLMAAGPVGASILMVVCAIVVERRRHALTRTAAVAGA